MAAYDLEEQEQIATLKAWWKQYGNMVFGLVTAAAVAALSWQGWNWYQRQQTAAAAAVYAALHKALRDNDTQRIKTAAGELADKYGGTAYAPLASLATAKALFEAGDARTAKLQLQWVSENGKDELRDLARIRLAALLLDEKSYDEAHKQLDAASGPAFATRVLDLRGDLFAAQSKPDEARTAWRAALVKLEEIDKSGRDRSSLQDGRASAAYRELLQLKIDALPEKAS